MRPFAFANSLVDFAFSDEDERMTGQQRQPRSIIAVVPVKRLDEAKQRLAPALCSQARRDLVLAMLSEVLATLATLPDLARILVISRDADVAAVAVAKGAEVV